jgi:hypothetical protein
MNPAPSIYSRDKRYSFIKEMDKINIVNKKEGVG